MPTTTGNPLDNYVTAAWMDHISTELRHRPAAQGSAGEQQSRTADAGQVAAYADRVADGGGLYDEQPFPELDEAWRPAAWLRSVARRMSGPFWAGYTDAQQARAVRFAARYVARQVREFYLEDWDPQRDARRRELSEQERQQPYELRARRVQLIADVLWHRRARMMMSAYVYVHADDETVPVADLQAILAMQVCAESRIGAAEPTDLPFF